MFNRANILGLELEYIIFVLFINIKRVVQIVKAINIILIWSDTPKRERWVL